MITNIVNVKLTNQHKIDLLRVFVGTNIRITQNDKTVIEGNLKFVLPKSGIIEIKAGDDPVKRVYINAIAEFNLGGE